MEAQTSAPAIRELSTGEQLEKPIAADETLEGVSAEADELEEEFVLDDEATDIEPSALVTVGQEAIFEGVGKFRTEMTGRLRSLRTDVEFIQTSVDLYAQQKWAEVDDELGIGETLGEDSTTYAAIEGTFTRMVSAAVTLIIGIYIFAEISDTMPTPDNSELANASDTVQSTTGSAFTLGAVAIIVLVASVILGLIGGFGAQRRSRR